MHGCMGLGSFGIWIHLHGCNMLGYHMSNMVLTCIELGFKPLSPRMAMTHFGTTKVGFLCVILKVHKLLEDYTKYVE